MDWTQCLLALVVVVTLVYWYLKRVHSHWEKQSVPFVPNPIPLFGHMLPVISIKENFLDFVDRTYKSYDSSMVGFFFMQQPGLIVRDPDLVKSVLQTEFSSFHSNALSLSEKTDPVFAKDPFFTKDPILWKARRSGVSSNLTSKKLKHLSVIVEEVSKKMSAFVDRKIEENNGCYECELKTNFIRYASELVANAAFAVEGHSFEDNPDNGSFSKMTVNIFRPSFVNGIKQALLLYVPSVANFFGLSLLSKSTDSYMRANIKAILKQRQQTGNSPNDYLQFSTESNTDLDGILADIVNFYLDVYETSSTVLANIFYCLSLNPEIQTKLRGHIESTVKENGGTIGYDSLQSMKYLDQVVYECLRCIPVAGVFMKRCNKAITLRGSDGLTCRLEPGDPVFIPVIGIHLDEQYWPDPKVFNPDRFDAENQSKNRNFTFLGFGEGPRKCVGMRFALLLLKQAVAVLLLNFTVEQSPNTKVPLEIDPSVFFLSFKGGLWGRFKKLA